MSPDWTLNIIGLLCAAAVTGMLAGVLVWFRRIYRQPAYGYWAWSWGAASVYSIAGAWSIALYGSTAPTAPVRIALTLLGQTAGYAAGVLLVMGTVEFTGRGPLRAVVIRWWLVLAGIASLIGTFAFIGAGSDGWVRFLMRVGVKSLLTTVAYLIAADRLWRLRPPAFAIGHRMLAGAFCLYGLAQLHYLGYAIARAVGHDPGYPVAYFTFVDAALLAAIALATVIAGLEDQRARAESNARAAEEAMRALDRQDTRFRNMIEHSNDVITILDADGIVRYESPSITRILGYGSDECLGKSAFDYLHADDLEGAFLALQRGIQSGEATTHRYRFRHKDGHFVHLESIGRVVDEAPFGQVVVINSRDVTERERLERQLLEAQKMESVGRLAGGVAHDFNNMLTIIKGNGELARTALARGRSNAVEVEEIISAADRAAQLTRQLLAFARRQIVAVSVVDGNELVRRIDKMVHRLLGETIEFTVAETASPARVRVDPGQLEQVLLNLVVNARDAMPHGGKLSVTVERVATTGDDAPVVGMPDGSWVTLSVSDSGTGMSDDVQAHLFEPFFTTKPTGEGTGLGLATSYGIVTQAGGFIAVESQVGRGSTFTVYLPLVEAPVAERPSQSGRRKLTGDEVVLVVEDEPLVRHVAVATLEGLGYRVLEAADGMEGLVAAQRDPGLIQLVVTDVVMPRMGGVAMAERLVRDWPALPIVFTSGYTDDPGSLGRLPGRSAFLQKPYSPADLAEQVRRLLDVAVTA